MEKVSDIIEDRAIELRQFDYYCVPCHSTCYVELDEVIGGFRPDQVVVVGGVPGVGKTSFALSMLNRMCRNESLGICFFTMESSNSEILDRLVEVMSGYSAYDVHDLNEIDWNQIKEDVQKYSSMPFFVEDKVVYYEDFKRIVQKKVEEGIRFVCIDNLQHLRLLDKSRKRTNEGDLHYIMYDIKQMSRELGVTFIVLAEAIDSSMFYDEDHYFVRHWMDIDGDENACSQVADVFLQLHRPEYHYIYEDDRGNDLRGKIMVYVRKNRNGPVGDCTLSFDKTTGAVSSLSERQCQELNQNSATDFCNNFTQNAPF